MNQLPFAFLIPDKRFQLFLLSAALAVVLAFFAIPDHIALIIVSKAGFWFVLASFAIFCTSLWLTYRDFFLRWREWKVDWASVAIVVLGGVILLVHETFGFKIVNDELMLLGTSMSMHFDKSALVPGRGNDIQGIFQLLDGMVDKRPLFFPFLTSLLHDLTGYRPANVFILNGALTFVFLGLVNLIGRLLAGRIGGWIGVVLLAGLPLLGHNATGGGFELLNLVMILGTLLLGAHYVERRDGFALTALCFSALLLAQVRYESGIYLLPVAAIILFVWYREGKASLPWPVIVAPLLMVHYPLHHRVFDLHAAAWELGSKPGYTKPFSLAYIPENLSHSLTFFFARPADQPNSLVLSVIGWLAVPFFLLLIVRSVRQLATQSPAMVATLLFAFGFIGQFVLMMVYFWGKFDDPVIRRLSLPTHLGMVIAVLAVLPQFSKIAVPRVLFGIAVLGLFSQGIPSMAAHGYSQEYLPAREVAWRRAFIAEQPHKDYLVIDNDSILWISHQISATPVQQAIKRRDSLVFHMRNRTFSDIYVFQRFNIDADTGHMTLRPGDDLGPGFVLEPVREERIQLLTLSRLSRLKEIREGETLLTAPDPGTHPMPADRETAEKARQAYFNNFLKQLP